MTRWLDRIASLTLGGMHQERPMACWMGCPSGWRPRRDSVLRRKAQPCADYRKTLGTIKIRARSAQNFGVPDGIRTRVLALKGPRPRPLDDGDAEARNNRL